MKVNPLKNWTTLNEAIMQCDEAQADKLLAAELRGKRRPTFLRRIHSRKNILRAAREREAFNDSASDHRLRDRGNSTKA